MCGGASRRLTRTNSSCTASASSVPNGRISIPPSIRAGPSVHPRAADLGAAHDAAEGAGVVDREMLAAAVVPECDRSRLPAEAAGELRTMAVLQKEVEQRLAL